MAAARRHWPPTPAEVRQILAEGPMPVLAHYSWTPGPLLDFIARAARNPVHFRREIEDEARAASLLAGRYLTKGQ